MRRILLALTILLPSLARADSTLVFNELHYHPKTAETSLEWLELHNQMAVDLDISGWRLEGGVDFQFPEGTVVAGGGYLVVALNPALLALETGFESAMGPFLGRLDNDGETLRLINNNDRLMDRLRYRDAGSWPVAPDGSGATLAKRFPDSSSGDPRNWTHSLQLGGTPGQQNFVLEGQAPPPPEGLVSYWSFDGSGSSVPDDAGNNDGVRGSTTDRVAGLVGPGALHFDNTHNAQVNVGPGVDDSFSFSQAVTIEALFISEYSGDPGDQDCIFRKEDGSQRVVLAIQNDGNDDGRSDPPAGGYTGPVLAFGLNLGGNYAELELHLDGQDGRPAVADLTDGAVHHVAATYQSSTGLKALYLDGQLVASVEVAPGTLIQSGGATSAYLGNMAGRLNAFQGTLDEVAVWSRALPGEEIAVHHAESQAGRDYFVEAQAGSEAPPLFFSEVFLEAGQPGWIEIQNRGASPIPLAGLVLESSAGPGTSVILEGPALEPGGFRVIEETELPGGIVPREKLFLLDAGGTRVVDAVYLREDHRALTDDPDLPRWQFPDQPTPGEANSFDFRDEVVISEIHYHPFPQPALPPQVESTNLIPMLATWEYTAPEEGLTDEGWRTGGDVGAAWSQGAALLYHESSDLPATKSTELELGPLAYYFRTTFELGEVPEAAELAITHIVDDGAVFYLNGQPIAAFNLPLTGVEPDTTASPGVSNGTLVGPISVPTEHLVAGTNWFAVEVHQSSPNSSDMAFGARLDLQTILTEGTPYGEPPASWLELLNRGPGAIDLTGWEFDDGIRFEFVDGTTLAAGERAILAEDVELFASLYPGVRILGEFRGNLSNSDDELVLLDSAGNVADRVEYFDGGRWDSRADGEGSSLELRDPDADNSSPEAWEASDETHQTTWKTYSYRQRAVARVGPTQWRELIIGLIDAGEALVDDISVVEDPDGAAVEFLQNGDFESGEDAWRILGNHRHSRVIEDPDDPGNQVLHLVATGPTEHMHNHLETTFRNGEALVNGREYRITFRARWLSGSDQFHSRLYFNRVASTIRLEGPTTGGTPGEINSVEVPNDGPTYRDLLHAPAVPEVGEPIEVTVRIADPDDVASARLHHAISGSWSLRPLTHVAGDLYRATIPGQPAATLIQFYVEATDGLGATTWFPAAGPDSRALVRVQDRRDRPDSIHSVRILMTPEDTEFLHAETNVMSNERLPGTMIYREQEIFYDVGVRLKGSQRGRPGGHRVSFSVRMDPMQLFRGVHQTISLDRSGGWGLGVGPTGQDEIIVKHIGNHAGEIPGMYDDLAHVIAPRSAQDGGCILMMAKYTDVFLESQFEDGDDGNLYKIELIYYPTSTVDGNPESLKRPLPDQVTGTDLRNLGDEKEAYRWTFLKENQLREDDWTGLIGLAKFLGQPSSVVARDAEQWLDVDQALRMYVLHSICGVNDTYWYAGNFHNAVLYRRPSDGKFLHLYWDNDFAFSRGVNASLWGSINLAKLFSAPRHQRTFYGHLDHILDRTFNSTYLAPWTRHYGRLVNEENAFQSALSYMQSRRNFVLSQMPASVPFEITTGGGQDLEVDTPTVTLQGTAPVSLRRLEVAGHPEPEVTWTTVTRWEMTLELSPGENEIVITGHDHDDFPSAMDSITVTTSFAFPAPQILAVSPPEAEPDTEIVLSGTGFLPGARVFLDDLEVPGARRVSSSRIELAVPFIAPGERDLRVENTDGQSSPPASFTILATLERFVRGDANLDSRMEIGDAVTVLLYLFRGRALSCLDAADSDGDDAIEIDDAVGILGHLFLGGPEPPAPYPEPGTDTGVDTPGCITGLRLE